VSSISGGAVPNWLKLQGFCCVSAPPYGRSAGTPVEFARILGDTLDQILDGQLKNFRNTKAPISTLVMHGSEWGPAHSDDCSIVSLSVTSMYSGSTCVLTPLFSA